MGMYHHLTFEERLLISRELEKGTRKEDIANMLGVSLQSIYYELNRKGVYMRCLNVNDEVYLRYSPELAQRQYEKNLKHKVGRKKKVRENAELEEFIRNEVFVKKSNVPLIFKKINDENSPFKGEIKSIQTLYKYVRELKGKVKK